MAKEKIIAVVGATGAQGSGLCRAITNDKNGGYRVRALTRKPGSDKGKELKKIGVGGVGARAIPRLMGKYKVPHFAARGEADQVFPDLGLPVTFLLTSFYWENLIHFGMGPKRGADGKLAITFPMGDKKLPGIGADDIGKCADAIFRKGGEYIAKSGR